MIEMLIIKGEPDTERRGCADCRHMKAAVNWWCTNKEAREWNGTSIPRWQNCRFWEPARKARWWHTLNPLSIFMYIFIKGVKCDSE